MGSFQQITMGIGCLIAAFWFGSVLQDRPAGQNQTTQLLPEGTIDPNRTAAGPSVVQKTKGFLDSFFKSPGKEKPITVADLRADAKLAIPTPGTRGHNSSFDDEHADRLSPAYSPIAPTTPTEDLVFDNSLLNPPLNPSLTTDPPKDFQPTKRFVGSFESADQPPRLTKVAIVPDFSSLAEEVNRGLSFNDDADIASSTPMKVAPLNPATNIELIPVPKFSDVQTQKPDPIPTPNWEAVREQVAAAERRLETYRDQMTQPIPEIAETVNRRTQEFWDRQQTEARRRPSQPSRLANHQTPDASQQRRLKPETWAQKQQRWDVFGNDRAGRLSQNQTQPRSKPRIVEVDRPWVEQPIAAQAQPQPQATNKSSAVVRSLNDDRVAVSPYVAPDNDRLAYNAHQRHPTVMQNQLRPRYNPNAGSQPEFVSPPDQRQFAAQTNSAPANSSEAPSSEIVEAAEVTYGSFREYETQPQDTLQTISEEFYGTADYYFDLYLANRDLLSNPATVPPGITIKIPRFDSR